MKQIIHLFILFTTIAFAACEKAENKIFFEGGTPPTVSATTNAVRLEAGEEANLAIRFNWTNPDYKFTTGLSSQNVNYTIEIDTVGSNFNSSKKFSTVIANDLSLTYTVGEFNAILGNVMQLQLDPRRTYNLEARVIAGIGSAVKLISGNKVSFTARPFPPPPKVATPFGNELFIVGGATPGGWNNPVPEPAQKMTRLSSTKYEIIVNLSSDFYLLLPQNGSWNNKYSVANKNLPGLGNGGDFGYNLNDDIPAPSTPGIYKLTFDFQLGKFTAVKQ